MSAIDSLKGDRGPWCGLLPFSEVVTAPAKKKRAKPAVSRRLLGDDEILDAVEWRLSGWNHDAIKVSEDMVAQLIDHGIPLDDSRHEVIEAMETFPRERRDPWYALCALAVIFAVHHRDRELFFTAGMEVTTAYRQANRAKPRMQDELSKLIAEHLAENLSVKPDILFNSFADRAGLFDKVLVDFNPDDRLLVVQPHLDDEAWIDVKHGAFLRRVQRIRRQIAKRLKPGDVVSTP